MSSKLNDEYTSQGYIHLKNIINVNLLDALKGLCCSVVPNLINPACLGDVHNTIPEKVNRYFPRTHSPLGIDALVAKLVSKPDLSSILFSICGGEIEVDPNKTILSWPPESVQKGFTGYHQDGPDDTYLEGFPHVWIPVEDSRVFNIKLIPSTHTLGNLPHGMFGQFVKVLPEYVGPLIDGEIKMKVEVGDALIFSTRILHCLALNGSDQTCWSLEFICNKKEENK